MKAAYLVVAHKNLEQIKHLVSELQNGTGDVFVHVDTCVDEKEYLSLCSQLQSERCVFVKDRIQGILDNRSLVDISMNCIGEALAYCAQKNCHYDYYVLISGQDYPIKPIKLIEKELEENYPMPYIESYSVTEAGQPAALKKYNRSRGLILYRDWVLRNFGGAVKKLFQAFGRMMYIFLKICGRTTAQKLKKIGVNVYTGSAWWILPDGIIEPIYAAYKNDEKLAKVLLEESCTPEETFFQTMCRTEKFSGFFGGIGAEEGFRNKKTYVDFGKQSNRKAVYHPYVLTVDDFERLKNSDCWFARKFDDNIDPAIIQKIDAEILKGQESFKEKNYAKD